MLKAAPAKTKKPAAGVKKAKAKPAARAKGPVAKQPAAKPVARAKKAATKASATKKAPAKPAVKAKKPVTKAASVAKKTPAKKAPAKAPGLPHVEITVKGQRYIVGEYGSLMTFEDYERVMAIKQQQQR